MFRLIHLAAMFLTLMLPSIQGNTASIGATAYVEIVPPLVINEVQAISFGHLSNLDGSCEMADSGALSGTDGQTCDNTQTPAVFSIAGGTGQQVSITVTPGASQDGVSFDPKLVGTNSKTLTGGSILVTVVGTLTMASATNGSKSLPYTVTVNYQ